METEWAGMPIEVIGTIGGLGLGALFIIFLGLVVVLEQKQKIAKVRERELSRREIAAYVAEGSISASDAAKLLNDKGKSVGEAISDALS